MTLWGEPDDDMLLLQRKPRKTITVAASNHMNGSCTYYGHSWEYFGTLIGLKRCTVCHVFGYCPVCTLVPPLQSARPFYCTAHTQE
jgi:hypothetical protein